MTPPKISIVIPSFNKVKFVSQTLESIFNQKYSNLEVIIQDGGSTDGTLEIIKKFADKYPKLIKLESRKDAGQGYALNRGLKKATGEILTFINADDIYIPGAFHIVSQAFQKNPGAPWFAGRGKVINTQGREVAGLATWYKNLLLSLNRRFFLLVTNYLMQPSVFFSKEAYEKFGPIPGIKKGIIEYDFWLNISREEMPVVIGKTLSAFRMSGENISSLYFSETLSADGKVLRKYTRNTLIILLHDLNNLGRVLFNKFI